MYIFKLPLLPALLAVAAIPADEFLRTKIRAQRRKSRSPGWCPQSPLSGMSSPQSQKRGTIVQCAAVPSTNLSRGSLRLLAEAGVKSSERSSECRGAHFDGELCQWTDQ